MTFHKAWVAAGLRTGDLARRRPWPPTGAASRTSAVAFRCPCRLPRRCRRSIATRIGTSVGDWRRSLARCDDHEGFRLSICRSSTDSGDIGATPIFGLSFGRYITPSLRAEIAIDYNPNVRLTDDDTLSYQTERSALVSPAASTRILCGLTDRHSEAVAHHGPRKPALRHRHGYTVHALHRRRCRLLLAQDTAHFLGKLVLHRRRFPVGQLCVYYRCALPSTFTAIGLEHERSDRFRSSCPGRHRIRDQRVDHLGQRLADALGGRRHRFVSAVSFGRKHRITFKDSSCSSSAAAYASSSTESCAPLFRCRKAAVSAAFFVLAGRRAKTRDARALIAAPREG